MSIPQFLRDGAWSMASLFNLSETPSRLQLTTFWIRRMSKALPLEGSAREYGWTSDGECAQTVLDSITYMVSVVRKQQRLMLPGRMCFSKSRKRALGFAITRLELCSFIVRLRLGLHQRLISMWQRVH